MNAPRDLTPLLLIKAREDHYLLRLAENDPAAPFAGMGFLAQQVVEKSVKAVLAARAVACPQTHNLAMLLMLAKNAGIALPPHADLLPQLVPFGVEWRYHEVPVEVPSALPRSELLAWATAETGLIT